MRVRRAKLHSLRLEAYLNVTFAWLRIFYSLKFSSCFIQFSTYFFFFLVLPSNTAALFPLLRSTSIRTDFVSCNTQIQTHPMRITLMRKFLSLSSRLSCCLSDFSRHSTFLQFSLKMYVMFSSLRLSTIFFFFFFVFILKFTHQTQDNTSAKYYSCLCIYIYSEYEGKMT